MLGDDPRVRPRRLAASGAEAHLRRRHAFFARDFAEAVYLGDHDTVSANARIEAEHDNLRSALEWARDSGADEVLLRLAAALVNHWRGRGLVDEEETWLSSRSRADHRPPERG